MGILIVTIRMFSIRYFHRFHTRVIKDPNLGHFSIFRRHFCKMNVRHAYRAF